MFTSFFDFFVNRLLIYKSIISYFLTLVKYFYKVFSSFFKFFSCVRQFVGGACILSFKNKPLFMPKNDENIKVDRIFEPWEIVRKNDK